MDNEENKESTPVHDPVIPIVKEPTKKEIFFQFIHEGSLDKIYEFQLMIGQQETGELVNSINEKGETPLLLAISKCDVWMVEYLVRNLNANVDQIGNFLWNGSEYLQGPPLFAAMLFESQYPARFPITFDTSLVEVLIDAEFPIRQFQYIEELDQINSQSTEDENPDIYPVLESVKNSALITRLQKIEILELIGSAYVLNNRTCVLGRWNRYIFCGIACWTEAMRLRDIEPVCPKVDDHLPECVHTILGFSKEFKTLEELEIIIPPNDNKPTNQCDLGANIKKQLHNQAVLVSMRILIPFQQGITHPFLFIFRHIVNNHLTYLEGIIMRRPFTTQQIYCLGVRLLLELSQFLKSKDYQDGQWPYGDCINSILFSMRWVITMQRVQRSNENLMADLLNFDNVMRILDLISAHVDTLPPNYTPPNISEYSNEKDKILHSIYAVFEYSLRLLMKMENKKNLKDGETRQLKIWLHHFNRFTRVNSEGRKNLLHFACHRYHELNTDVIAMLLDAGADPNEGDENHDTPAHYIADHTYLLSNILDAIRLLVGGGAHLNRANKNNETAIEKLRELGGDQGNDERLALEKLIDEKCCMASGMHLTCLSAEVLRQNGILYDQQKYPPLLVPFLESHGANRPTCLPRHLRM